MDIFKSIEVVHDINKTTFLFKGNEGERDDFLSSFYTAFLDRFRDKGKSFYKPFLYLFKEVVKNIYDHGTGKASLVMIDNKDFFSFEFIDENPTIIKFADVNDNWKQKSEHNFGAGLRQILKICKECNIELRIDDTKGGIHYYGMYIKAHSM